MRKRNETPVGKVLRKYAIELLDLQFAAEIETANSAENERESAIRFALDCSFWIDRLATEYGHHHRWSEFPRIYRGNKDVHARILAVLEALAKELASIEFAAKQVQS